MRRSIARIVVSGVALAAFGAVLAVPATADVADVSVAVGAEGLLTGCRYTVTAGVTDAAIPPGSVFFVLSGGVIPGNGERIPGGAVHHPENNTVTATWTPARGGAGHPLGHQVAVTVLLYRLCTAPPGKTTPNPGNTPPHTTKNTKPRRNTAS
ncbi:hypothetical protein, partial [Nocardia brasiliensis]|uniref:hypothetical protein n=1 Tax=Nocardia brasiliensis TaxID=37326 RepID=UPI00245854D3